MKMDFPNSEYKILNLLTVPYDGIEFIVNTVDLLHWNYQMK